MENYKHIELSEDEVNEALIWAKQKKSHLQEVQALKDKEKENRKAFTQTQFDYKQTLSFMMYRMDKQFEGKFKIDESNEFLFSLMCHYFSRDEKFVTLAKNAGVDNPSLDKGLMLAGNFGVGKTWLMKLFSRNQRQVFFIRPAKQIANEFQESGTDEYTGKFKNAINDVDLFYHSHSGLCIDDVGTEDIKTHFGNKKNVIGDLIETRYSAGNTGLFLHATTNLTAEQLKEFYGGRVTSRMREIFNWIIVKGNDRRK